MTQIFGNSLLVSEKSLDYLWQKQSITASNITNIDTPGYKARYVTFEDTYRQKLKAASGNRAQVRRAAAGAVWDVDRSETESARLDGNNVVADTEMTELTRTALQYQFQLQSINSEITRLSTVIKG